MGQGMSKVAQQKANAEAKRAKRLPAVEWLNSDGVVRATLTDNPPGFSTYFLPPDRIPDAEIARKAVQSLQERNVAVDPASGFVRLKEHGAPKPYFGLVIHDDDPVVQTAKQKAQTLNAEDKPIESHDALKRLNQLYSGRINGNGKGRSN